MLAKFGGFRKILKRQVLKIQFTAPYEFYHFDVCIYVYTCAYASVHLCIYASRLEAATMGGGLPPPTPPGTFEGLRPSSSLQGEPKAFAPKSRVFAPKSGKTLEFNAKTFDLV